MSRRPTGRPSGRPRPPRLYPYEPLVKASRCDSEDQLVIHLGISGSTWQIAKKLGLTDRQADRWAIAFGYHPSNIWPEWFSHVPPPDPTKEEEDAA